MNTNSNKYIIIYSSVMVVIVATALAFAALSLKGRQDENVRVEKMGDILHSIGQGAEVATAPDKAKYIGAEYEKYITKSYLINASGEVEQGDAFAKLLNLKSEYDKPAADRLLPLFEGVGVEGEELKIFPVWGKGLWGPIWGYIALKSDWSTVYGVVFDHKGETPGLGAEIVLPEFTDQFKGKEIYQSTNLISISVLKGNSSGDNIHAVDAITGGTITSRGVETMLKDCLGGYSKFIESKRVPVESEPVIDSLNIEPKL